MFEKHASDSELNLQPGGSYFIADNREELNAKIEYELMPLMKEYFDEGCYRVLEQISAISFIKKFTNLYTSNGKYSDAMLVRALYHLYRIE